MDREASAVYRHTQKGTLVRVALAIPLVLLAALLARGNVLPVTLGVAAMLLLLIALFYSLTVEVSRERVRIRFGAGGIGKTFPVSEIRQARAVRNPWYYGWGVRWFPRGWLFNVSGFDAVELTMHDGRVYRIGTDEPEKFLAAIRGVIRG